MLTPLSTLLTRMNRFQTISTIEEQYKVLDLDDAIRTIKRNYQLPWMLKKSSIRVFDGVLEYPTAVDHDYLAYLERPQNLSNGSQGVYADRFRGRYTSIQQFYEDPDNRNTMAEIFDTNVKYLGIRDKITDGTSQLVDSGEVVANYVASNDASNVVLDTVLFVYGQGSIRFTNTNATNLATITCNFQSFTNVNYLRNYFFVSVYLSGVPTSIKLTFGNDVANNLSTTVTAQFSGQPFKINQWNTLAFDLNTATTLGVINPNAFDYFRIDFNNAPSGFYNIDASFLKEWDQLDYWYYSSFAVQTINSTTPDQEYFNNISQIYKLDSSLVGDTEWTDVILYEACLLSLTDKENEVVYKKVKEKRDEAWDDLIKIWPSMKPVITTTSYRFLTDFNNGDNWYFN